MTAALAGACASMAILSIALGLIGTVPRQHDGRPPARWRTSVRALQAPERRNRVAAAVLTFAVVLALVGWPVAALATAAAVYALPPMLSGRRPQRRIARLEALVQWSLRLAEVMGASRGLEQTLTDSVRVAPKTIRAPVSALAERLNNRAYSQTALRAFATELDDPIGDLIACALILAAKRRGPGAREALISLADAVAQEVVVRREVEAERASLRTTLLVIVISVTGLSIVFLSSGTMAAPYGTALGQVVLAAVTGIYAAGLLWLQRLAVLSTGTRLLHTTGSPSPRPASEEEARTR